MLLVPLSRIQTLMTHIQRTCQEIRDIKNPLRSRKSKLINKVHLRSPGPNHDSSKEHLQDRYGEDAPGDSGSSCNTPTLPLDQWRNLCTNQEDGERSSSPPPSPTPTSPCPSHTPTPACESTPPVASGSPGLDGTPCTSDLDVLKLPSSSEEEETELRSGAGESPDPDEGVTGRRRGEGCGHAASHPV